MSTHSYENAWDLCDSTAGENSVMNKMQQKFWKTKQQLIKVTGKKEDEFIVASDAELDRKLEVFHDIQKSCVELLAAIEQYQKRVGVLSEEENEIGRFLKNHGSKDTSTAGKMMCATGKALSCSSLQRLALLQPLTRMRHEVETFRYRAISDTLLTVNRMEQARTDYRGALLWMKDISQELDPDTFKQMEKFRKVQFQVRETKRHFDQLKSDVCQKVDLLGASRCNLLSHTLASYQTTLLHFWEKTSHTMAAIHESYKDYQPFVCPMVKKPTDVALKSKKNKDVENAVEASDADKLISLDDSSTMDMANKSSDSDLLDVTGEPQTSSSKQDTSSDSDLLDVTEQPQTSTPKQGVCNFFDTFLTPENPSIHPQSEGDNITGDLALIEEILSPSSLSDTDSFARQWNSVFGDVHSGVATQIPVDSPPVGDLFTPAQFMPSQLLDMANNPAPAELMKETTNNQQSKAFDEGAKDMSAWFNIFADLDPLQNPDSIGRSDEDQQLLSA